MQQNFKFTLTIKNKTKKCTDDLWGFYDNFVTAMVDNRIFNKIGFVFNDEYLIITAEYEDSSRAIKMFVVMDAYLKILKECWPTLYIAISIIKQKYKEEPKREYIIDVYSYSNFLADGKDRYVRAEKKKNTLKYNNGSKDKSK